MLFTFSSWDAKKTKPSYIVEKKQWERFLWREKSLLFSCRKTCAATPHRSPSPSEKSFLRGRRSCYLRPRVALPTAVSSTNGGRKSITCSYLCSDSLSVTYFRTSVGVFFLYFQIPDNKTFMELRVKSSEVRVKWKIWNFMQIGFNFVGNTNWRCLQHCGAVFLACWCVAVPALQCALPARWRETDCRGEKMRGGNVLLKRKNVQQSNFFFHSFTPPNPLIDIEVGAFCE